MLMALQSGHGSHSGPPAADLTGAILLEMLWPSALKLWLLVG